MGKKVFLVLLSIFLAAGLSSAVMAQHGHGHGGTAAPSKPMGKPHELAMKGQSVTLEGLKITFEAMSMAEHMKMLGHMQHMQMSKSGGHGEANQSKSHMMVTLQDTASKEIISDAKVQFTVVTPSGQKETGKLEWSGDHYGGDFAAKEKGKYQVQLSIESGGIEREAKFQYEAK